jgi:hypothetical protein
MLSMILLVVHSFGVQWPMHCLQLSGSLGEISTWLSGLGIMLEGKKLYFVLIRDKTRISAKVNWNIRYCVGAEELSTSR